MQVKGPRSLALLSAEEEAALARMIEAGVAASAVLAGHPLRTAASREELMRIAAVGESARERFLLSNLRLVAFAMAGITGRDPAVRRDDVFQEGAVAMAEALRGFDWRRGRFSTFALSKVRWRVHEYVAGRGGSLGVPAHRAREIRRARAIEARLESEVGRPVRPVEVAAELGQNEAHVESLLRHRSMLSIDGMFGEMQERALARSHPHEPLDDPRADLGRLSAAQREALVLRFGLADGRPRSYREIAEETGQSTSTARRFCDLGLEALRTQAFEASDAEAAAVLAAARTNRQRLGEVDRLSRAGLSLVEVAIALKTEPVAVHDMCLAGKRLDLLARFGRLEQAHGLDPGPYTAAYVVVTEETARRRKRFLAGEAALGDPPGGKHPLQVHETITPHRTDPRHDRPEPQPGARESVRW